MTNALKKWTPPLLIWGAVIYGALQITNVKTRYSDSACGPWGCGPTLEALVSYHAFWLALMSLPVFAIATLCSRKIARRVGAFLTVIGLVTVISVAVHVAVFWYPDVSAWKQPYWKHRFVYQLALLTDVPATQSLIYGSFLLLITRRRRASSNEPTAEPPEMQHVPSA